MNGILIVNKPEGKTSFDYVRDVRIKYQTKKVGHIGTLDPLAQGILPILVGEATKLSDYLMDHDKEYIAVLKLGEKRSTGDREGIVLETRERITIDENCVLNVLNSFLGETDQIPPMYSALKVEGKKLYELARSGKTVERAPKKITITEIELLEIDSENNTIRFRVVCSKGTYIRVLCEDIAEKLGTCGYMEFLQRTRVGKFTLNDQDKFIDLEDILDVKRVSIEDIKHYENGLAVSYKECDESANNNNRDSSSIVRVYNKDKFIGLGKIDEKENNFRVKRFILV